MDHTLARQSEQRISCQDLVRVTCTTHQVGEYPFDTVWNLRLTRDFSDAIDTTDTDKFVDSRPMSSNCELVPNSARLVHLPRSSFSANSYRWMFENE